MFACLFLLSILSLGSTNPWTEEERIAIFHERGYTWPPTELRPETPGWRSLFERRYQQVAAMDPSMDKYHAWLLTVGSSIVSHNFTETGWAMTRAPDSIVQTLQNDLHRGMSTSTEENKNMCRDMGLRFAEETPPMYVPNDKDNYHILQELLWMHEAWSGLELVPAVAYGLRYYQNQSELLLHVDNPNTHIISSILHIDHSDDAKPWPLVMEDFEGNTNQIIMTSGDLVFYESSKLFHGRPSKFHGSWYSSLFLHYYPKGWDTSGNNTNEYHYGIPPNWQDVKDLSEGIEPVQMFGMGMEERTCPESWCQTATSITYQGPAKEGFLMSYNGERPLIRRSTISEEL
jgi:hypothetical protein